MDPLSSSPFAALTIIVAPAILTNASSVLSLGTGNRIARVVDRTRVLASELAGLDPASALAATYRAHLERLKVRSQMLLRALRCFYASIGAFASAALISVMGAILATSAGDAIFRAMAILSFVAGSIGVGGLVIGCAVMVRETQLAVRFLEREAELIQRLPPRSSPDFPPV
jgi:uncharacterized protein DUF2721